jgi:vancomycin resistance protein YoaR
LERELERTSEQVPVRSARAGQDGTARLDVRALRRSRRRKLRRALIPLVITVAVLGGGYVGAAYYFADLVPKDITVAGVEIGGLTSQEAVAKLDQELDTLSKAPIHATLGEQDVVIDPLVAGLSFSAESTVRPLVGLDFRPARLWEHITGLGPVKPAVVVDSTALDTHLSDLAAQWDVPPVDATLSVATGAVVTTPPASGLSLDVTTASSYVRDNYLVTSQPWTLPTVATLPLVDQAELDRAVTEIAEPLLSGPVTVSVGDTTFELSVGELAAAAFILPVSDAVRPDGAEGPLALSWDVQLLVAAAAQALPAGVTANPANARFVFEGDQVVIKDGTPGTALDPAGLAESVAKAALAEGSARVATAPLVTADPAEGRAELEKLGVKEVVGRFETQATNDYNRTRNLRKAAEIVTGMVVRPGERFSLDQALGHRSAETGWFNAGVVVAGVSQDGIGGGLSQFSTTLYNAAHLAGMVDVAHTPHSNYFSRYPMGREATIWEGEIDNVFENDTPYGVVLRAGVTDGLKVWVELWSTKYWSVEAEIGAPHSYVAPKTIESTAADCKPQSAGSSGFQVEYWRIKTDPQGAAQPKETWTWRYSPMNAIVCKTATGG